LSQKSVLIEKTFFPAATVRIVAASFLADGIDRRGRTQCDTEGVVPWVVAARYHAPWNGDHAAPGRRVEEGSRICLRCFPSIEYLTGMTVLPYPIHFLVRLSTCVSSTVRRTLIASLYPTQFQSKMSFRFSFSWSIAVYGFSSGVQLRDTPPFSDEVNLGGGRCRITYDSLINLSISYLRALACAVELERESTSNGDQVNPAEDSRNY